MSRVHGVPARDNNREGKQQLPHLMPHNRKAGAERRKKQANHRQRRRQAKRRLVYYYDA